MSKLEFKAGVEAYKLIQKEGLTADMIRGVASAAGGPKWFSVYHLTKYIISDLLSNVHGPLDFIGSSVGSWQMTAAATSDPAASMERLKRAYAEHLYSDKPNAAEITAACEKIIVSMISDQTANIINHPTRKVHVITSRGRGSLSSDNKIVLGASFGVAAMANAFNRRFNDTFVERTIFSNTTSVPFDKEIDILSTRSYRLTFDNLRPALQGSGAIPFMMEGIKDIDGARKGTYWDGGITDYHISLPYSLKEPGIVLHPHFGPNVLAGWFDKKLPWTRRAIDANMSNVLLIHPSESFIQSLPMGQITDLKDFYHFADNQYERIKYWSTVIERTLELAEELDEVIRTGTIMNRLQQY